MSQPKENKLKKPVCVFVVYDDNNKEHARKFRNSLRKFHSESELPLIEITGDELKEHLAIDPNFFYRQKPIIAERLLEEYELVIGMDVDQIVVGELSYIWNTKDYDVGTVLNWNRVDPEKYGVVAGWGILPIEYFNCGLVVIRSQQFAHHWKVNCFSPQFDRLQYKEQDILNAICYFGNYNVRCFDHGDGPAKMNAWWGLFGKGEYPRAQLISGAGVDGIIKDEIIVPKGLGDTPFPPVDITLKVLHWGGGNDPQKGNYRTMFNNDIIKRIDYLTSNEPEKSKTTEKS